MRSYYFFLMIRRPPRSTLDRSSAASDVYKRQEEAREGVEADAGRKAVEPRELRFEASVHENELVVLSLIHISEPTRPY